MLKMRNMMDMVVLILMCASILTRVQSTSITLASDSIQPEVLLNFIPNLGDSIQPARVNLLTTPDTVSQGGVSHPSVEGFNLRLPKDLCPTTSPASSQLCRLCQADSTEQRKLLPNVDVGSTWTGDEQWNLATIFQCVTIWGEQPCAVWSPTVGLLFNSTSTAPPADFSSSSLLNIYFPRWCSCSMCDNSTSQTEGRTLYIDSIALYLPSGELVVHASSKLSLPNLNIIDLSALFASDSVASFGATPVAWWINEQELHLNLSSDATLLQSARDLAASGSGGARRLLATPLTLNFRTAGWKMAGYPEVTAQLTTQVATSGITIIAPPPISSSSTGPYVISSSSSSSSGAGCAAGDSACLNGGNGGTTSSSSLLSSSSSRIALGVGLGAGVILLCTIVACVIYGQRSSAAKKKGATAPAPSATSPALASALGSHKDKGKKTKGVGDKAGTKIGADGEVVLHMITEEEEEVSQSQRPQASHNKKPLTIKTTPDEDEGNNNDIIDEEEIVLSPRTPPNEKADVTGKGESPEENNPAGTFPSPLELAIPAKASPETLALPGPATVPDDQSLLEIAPVAEDIATTESDGSSKDETPESSSKAANQAPGQSTTPKLDEVVSNLQAIVEVTTPVVSPVAEEEEAQQPEFDTSNQAASSATEVAPVAESEPAASSVPTVADAEPVNEESESVPTSAPKVDVPITEAEIAESEPVATIIADVNIAAVPVEEEVKPVESESLVEPDSIATGVEPVPIVAEVAPVVVAAEITPAVEETPAPIVESEPISSSPETIVVAQPVEATSEPEVTPGVEAPASSSPPLVTPLVLPESSPVTETETKSEAMVSTARSGLLRPAVLVVPEVKALEMVQITARKPKKVKSTSDSVAPAVAVDVTSDAELLPLASPSTSSSSSKVAPSPSPLASPTSTNKRPMVPQILRISSVSLTSSSTSSVAPLPSPSMASSMTAPPSPSLTSMSPRVGGGSGLTTPPTLSRGSSLKEPSASASVTGVSGSARRKTGPVKIHGVMAPSTVKSPKAVPTTPKTVAVSLTSSPTTTASSSSSATSPPLARKPSSDLASSPVTPKTPGSAKAKLLTGLSGSKLTTAAPGKFFPILFFILTIVCSFMTITTEAKRTININFDNLYPESDPDYVSAPLTNFPVRVVNTSSAIGDDIEVNLNYVHVLSGLDPSSNAQFGVFCDAVPPVCVGVDPLADPPSFQATLADYDSPFGTLQGACRTNYAYSGTQILQCSKPGSVIEVRWLIENIGSHVWTTDDVNMVSVNPPYLWPSTTVYLDSNTAPGEVGTFVGIIRTPVAVGLWNLTWAITSNCIGSFGTFTAPIELTCSNGIFCDGMERLVNGVCVSAVKKACDDGQKCTIDSCNEAEGLCTWTMNTLDSTCAFVPSCYTVAAGQTCVRTCGTTRVCGDDGCGGSCGSCPYSFGCTIDGQCQYIQSLGSCVKPLPLLGVNETLVGLHNKTVDLSHGLLMNKLSCSPDITGPQMIYTFTIPNDNVTYGLDMRFSNGINLASTLDTLLELRKGYCTDPAVIPNSWLSGPTQNTWCNDDNTPPGRVGSSITATLTAGVYYLIAAGFNSQQDTTGFLISRFTRNYTPYCQSRYCGPDGGGGDCGPCPSGLVCDSLLRCSSPPSSATCTINKCMNNTAVCGTDSCGNKCGPLNGACPDGQLCIVATGQCGTFPVCNHYAPVCVGGCNSTSFCATDCTCRQLADPLPDLFIYSDRLRDSLVISQRSFDNFSCALVEGCIDGLGVRTLLRFDTSIINQGRVKLALPSPPTRPDEFVYGVCHNHYHYMGFAEYQLLTQSASPSTSGIMVKRGHKQGYCMLAENHYPTVVGPDIPCRGTTTCDQPGLDRGWMDTYGNSLDCQWIDITGVPTGNYTLRVEINAQRRILEETFDNNVEFLTVWIP